MIVGFIGLGLIGGSIARALKHDNDQDFEIMAYDIDTPDAVKQLNNALSDGIINHIVTDFDQDFSRCELIFLCAPVHINATYLERLKNIISANCLITDVGSVKTPMLDAVAKLDLERHFIGGHPMAGSERSGYENSNEHLLENAYYILTPTKETTKENLDFLCSLVKRMSAIPLVLEGKEHDNITASISHVPHIIAALLVNLVKDHDDKEEKMRMLAAGGFKDITRIASSSPAMWQSICMTNADSIKNNLLYIQSSIQQVIDAIDEKDGKSIYELFDEAGTYRSLIPNSKGLLNRYYELYLDITDEPGAIAIIATLLGSNGISIKNIGIIHNREFEEGVLRIELYSEEAMSRAYKILNSHNYTIYERK